jgi:hypothetical protein
MLGRLARHIRRYFAASVDPDLIDLGSLSRDSCHLTGWFDFLGDQICGWAENTLEPWDQDLTIFVIRGREIIASGRVKEKSATVGWRFAIETNSRVSADDILYERVAIFVRDATGNAQVLRLEGSTQLELIRDLITDPVIPFLEIDFREGGNSSMFVMEGWSGQEKVHRWTEGTQSALAFTSPPHDRHYALQLLLWPYIVPGRLTEQRLRILVNETEVARFNVPRQSFLRCAVPPCLLAETETARMVVRFIHPDAASPASLGVGDDSRTLALAFKKVKIVPVTGSDPD